MATRFPSAIIVAMVLILSAPSAFARQAEDPEIQEGYIVGWHTVRPTDTLEGITQQYMGSDELWRENWKLNPEIGDPDQIWPGQRIKVILDIAEAVPTARLHTLAGKVESRPVPIPWHEAQKDELLLERDGIQTYEKASTELEFQDGTTVVLTENSLVFVNKAGIALTGVGEKSVEIVEGQADIQANLDAGSSAEIEILVGDAVATAQLNADGSSQTRARKVGDAGGQVMVYEGVGAVEAGGATVNLTKGMGTTIAAGAAPTDPEKLLSAPTAREPAPGSRLEFSTPHFSWTPVADAASYTVEICHDPRCGDLVDLVADLSEEGWQPGSLPEGDFYWRVTAVSKTGLDGYPSKPAALGILSAAADTTPPAVAVSATGPSIRVGKRLIFDDTLALDVSSSDTQSGVARWIPTLNGEEVPAERWKGPWEEGEYSVTAIAYDKAGNPNTSEEVFFVVDTEPPSIGMREQDNRGRGRTPVPPKTRQKWIEDGHEWIEWSVDGTVWLPLVWGDATSTVRAYLESDKMRARFDPGDPVSIRGSEPQLLIRAPAGNPFAAEGQVTLAPDKVLRIYAHDAWSGARRFDLKVDESGDQPAIVIETEDVLGHTASLRLPLRADLSN